MSKDKVKAFSGRISIGQLMSRVGSPIIELSDEQLLAFSKALKYASANSYEKLLSIADEMDTPEAIRSLLPSLLAVLGVELPDGMFKPSPGRPGRPRKLDNAMIYEKWLALGRPGPGSMDFARACLGREFNIAKPEDKKRAVNRCYRAVKRAESTKPEGK